MLTCVFQQILLGKLGQLVVRKEGNHANYGNQHKHGNHGNQDNHERQGNKPSLKQNILIINKDNYIHINSKKVKLSRYTPWRHMGGEEV
jgi:hypothetical protein